RIQLEVPDVEFPQCVVVVEALLATSFEDLRDVREHAESHRGMKFGVLSIDADAGETLRTVVSEVAHVRHALEDIGIRGEYRAAFDRVKDLRGVKTGGADVAVLEHG